MIEPIVPRAADAAPSAEAASRLSAGGFASLLTSLTGAESLGIEMVIGPVEGNDEQPGHGEATPNGSEAQEDAATPSPRMLGEHPPLELADLAPKLPIAIEGGQPAPSESLPTIPADSTPNPRPTEPSPGVPISAEEGSMPAPDVDLESSQPPVEQARGPTPTPTAALAESSQSPAQHTSTSEAPRIPAEATVAKPAVAPNAPVPEQASPPPTWQGETIDASPPGDRPRSTPTSGRPAAEPALLSPQAAPAQPASALTSAPELSTPPPTTISHPSPALSSVRATLDRAGGPPTDPETDAGQQTTPSRATSMAEGNAPSTPLRVSQPMVSRLVERVESWVRQSENMPPPRTMTLTGPQLEGMSIRVTLANDGIAVQIHGVTDHDLRWIEHLGDQLRGRGFELSEFSSYDEEGEGRPVWDEDRQRRRRPQRDFVLPDLDSQPGGEHD